MHPTFSSPAPQIPVQPNSQPSACAWRQCWERQSLVAVLGLCSAPVLRAAVATFTFASVRQCLWAACLFRVDVSTTVCIATTLL